MANRHLHFHEGPAPTDYGVAGQQQHIIHDMGAASDSDMDEKLSVGSAYEVGYGAEQMDAAGCNKSDEAGLVRQAGEHQARNRELSVSCNSDGDTASDTTAENSDLAACFPPADYLRADPIDWFPHHHGFVCRGDWSTCPLYNPTAYNLHPSSWARPLEVPENNMFEPSSSLPTASCSAPSSSTYNTSDTFLWQQVHQHYQRSLEQFEAVEVSTSPPVNTRVDYYSMDEDVKYPISVLEQIPLPDMTYLEDTDVKLPPATWSSENNLFSASSQEHDPIAGPSHGQFAQGNESSSTLSAWQHLPATLQTSQPECKSEVVHTTVEETELCECRVQAQLHLLQWGYDAFALCAGCAPRL